MFCLDLPKLVAGAVVGVLHDLHEAAGAEAVRTEAHELLGVVEGADPAGGLYLHARADMLMHELHVIEGCARSGKTGGGLDELCARLRHDLTHLYLLFLCEKAGLDDDLQDVPVAGLVDLADLILYFIVSSIFQKANVDDHVDLRRPVCDGILRLEDLRRGRAVAVREANDGADRESAVDIGCSLLHVGRRDARRRAMVLDAIIEDGLYVCPGRGLREQGVIYNL